MKLVLVCTLILLFLWITRYQLFVSLHLFISVCTFFFFSLPSPLVWLVSALRETDYVVRKLLSRSLFCIKEYISVVAFPEILSLSSYLQIFADVQVWSCQNAWLNWGYTGMEELLPKWSPAKTSTYYLKPQILFIIISLFQSLSIGCYSYATP